MIPDHSLAMLHRGKALYRPLLAATTYLRQITVCAEVPRQSGTTCPPHLRPRLPSTLQVRLSVYNHTVCLISALGNAFVMETSSRVQQQHKQQLALSSDRISALVDSHMAEPGGSC